MVRVNCSSAQSGSKCSKNRNKCHIKQLIKARCRRNPYLIFVSHFRKNQRVKDYNLSPSQCLAVAGKVWSRMTAAEKQPYIDKARSFNYVFKSRNKQVNWVLKKLRQMLVDGPLRLSCLRQLAIKMTAWSEGFIDNFLKLLDKRSLGY